MNKCNFMFLYLKFILFYFTLGQQQEITFDWSKYLLDNNATISIKFRILKSTNGIKEFSKIKSLVLNENGLKEISEIKFLVNLETIDLSDNFLEAIDDLKYLTNLTSLVLINNKIKSLFIVL